MSLSYDPALLTPAVDGIVPATLKRVARVLGDVHAELVAAERETSEGWDGSAALLFRSMAASERARTHDATAVLLAATEVTTRMYEAAVETVGELTAASAMEADATLRWRTTVGSMLPVPWEQLAPAHARMSAAVAHLTEASSRTGGLLRQLAGIAPVVPPTPKPRRRGPFLSGVHLALGTAGILFPPADGIDAAIYMAEGDEVNAGMSAVGIFPGAKEVGLAARIGTTGVAAGRTMSAADLARAFDDTVARTAADDLLASMPQRRMAQDLARSATGAERSELNRLARLLAKPNPTADQLAEIERLTARHLVPVRASGALDVARRSGGAATGVDVLHRAGGEVPTDAIGRAAEVVTTHHAFAKHVAWKGEIPWIVSRRGMASSIDAVLRDPASIVARRADGTTSVYGKLAPPRAADGTPVAGATQQGIVVILNPKGPTAYTIEATEEQFLAGFGQRLDGLATADVEDVLRTLEGAG